MKPQIPEFADTKYPSVELRAWGDYRVYKEQCEVQIDVCNADKHGIIRAILGE
jgi:hypothetical protein